MVYGKEGLLPIKFQIHTSKLVEKLGLDLSEAQHQIFMQLNELDEIIQQVVEHTSLVQQYRIKWHERFIRNKIFIRDIGHVFSTLSTNFQS